MKKRLLSIILVGTICLSFAACGENSKKTEKESSDASTETSSQAKEEEVEEEADAVVEVIEGYSHTPEYDEALSNADVYGGTDGKNYDDVKSAYTAAIADVEANSPQYSFTYSLIYVNEDDVPELVCNSNDETFGVYLISYHEGSLNYALTSGTEFTYIEKQNIVDNTGVVLGAYYDNLLAIRDGQWVLLGYGEKGTSDPWAEDSFDENGDPIVDTWTWDDDYLKNDADYNSVLELYYSADVAKSVDKYVSKDEITTEIDGLQ
ncbi:MAG: hypothetical protein J6Y86_03080 [Pseudobutyrivibrio sp.]|nr:hypothetical protein [Pseudobutyrivibrio sp.]